MPPNCRGSRARCGEVRKRRPAVIISNDAANKHLNLVQVLPLTISMSRAYPSEAVVTLEGKQNQAMADQLTTVSKRRLINRAGKLAPSDMRMVERALRVQLGLLEIVG